MKDSIMPPFRIMFQSTSVPSSANLDLYLAELDAQLEENNKEIDTCMQSILQFTKDLPGANNVSDPKEGLIHMINNHVLEKDSCYDPEVDDSVAILNGLLSMIEENPGSEERVLQEILSLSAAEGLIFPLQTSTVNTVPISMSSLHTIEDTTDKQIEAKWSKITQRLKKHFVEKLLRLPVQKNNLPGIPVNQRLRLVQCLLAIAPDEEVWQCYQSLRTQQLEKSFRDLFPESDTFDYQSFSSHCDLIASTIINMIDEDFVVLNTGMFRKVIGVFKAIHDLYLEKYSDEMSLLVEEVSDDIFKIRHNTFAHGNITQNKRDKLQKGQSLDSIMPSRIIAQPQGEAIVNAGCIQSLLHIIKSLLAIEEHINTLLRNTAWDVVGVSTKKAKRRGSLRGVLKTTSSPEQRRHSLRVTELNNSDTQIDSSISSATSTIATPKVIERTKTEERLHWDWKLMFKKISGDITQAVEASINNSVKISLQEELTQWQNTHTLTPVNVKLTLQGGKQDYPKVITKSVHEFMATCDSLLVFARAGCDGSLSAVRAAYIDNISTSLKLVHEHIVKLCVDVPIKANIKQLYLLLSNAVYCRNQLTHCETVLCTDDAGKKVFLGLLKQLSDLVESLSKQILDIHNQLLATTVLHDAECHHWNDSKDFYEDERCSYTVQMWNFYMRGLQYDLWTVCPPRLAQNIFGSVLHESLQMLTLRYVRVKPSFKRFKQYRYDLTAILLCSSEFLFQVCQSMSQYLDPGHCDIPQYNIHNLCSTLISSLAVVTSPIDQLYRTFKRGYGKRRDSNTEQIPGSVAYGGSNTQWLHWIYPSLFFPGHKHYDDMQTTNAVYLQTKLLLNQSIWEPSTLLQALIMKDYTLPIMLLTRVASLDSMSSGGSNGLQSEQKKDCCRIFSAVLSILSQCSHFPDGVAKVLMPVIDRCEDWDVLNARKTSTLECEPPIWMMALFDLIAPYIDSVLEPLIIYVLNLPSLVTGKGCLIPEIQELPCGCRPNKYDTDHSTTKKGERFIIESALKIVVAEMSEKIHALNSAFCVACYLLQEACHQNNFKTPHNCAGLIIIGRCVRERLLDSKYIESMIGQDVQEETYKLLTVLADCIYSVLIYGRAKSSISTPKMASQFVKANKEWLTSKIQLIAVHLSNDLFSVPDTDILEGATSNFADHIFTATVASILNDSNGYENLVMTYNLIKRNWTWVEEQLDIKLSLKNTEQTKTTAFQLDLTPVKDEKFIPQKEFIRIGDSEFSQEALMSFPFNWNHMLQSDLGLSENGFSSLLYNRHEMQDGAYLEENEKRPVEILRSIFEKDSSDMI
ncbi:hypothetical protein SNE40_011497 [Patella caerulea]|uniref:Uncharacterized protein n=1 Tax=Patella caerulea TaxID=87958 RepID=A0AAN8PU46_PATCE